MIFQDAEFPQAGWRKSVASTGNGACIEVHADARVTKVRDSRDPAGPVMAVSHSTWRQFVSQVRNGYPGNEL